MNQSFTLSTNFLKEQKKQIDIMIWSKIQETFSQVMRSSSFIFEENNLFIEEENPQTNLIQLTKNKMGLI